MREADARREHWNGHSLTPAEASAAERHRDRPDRRISSSRSSPRCSRARADDRVEPTEVRAFFEALGQGRARLALLLEPQRI